MWEPAWLLRGSQGSLAGQAVPLPLLPPWAGVYGQDYLCSAAPGAVSSSSSQTRIHLLLPVPGWLKVRVTLGGSVHTGAHRDFPDGERGAGTGKSQMEEPPGCCRGAGPLPQPLPIPAPCAQAWAVVLKRVGCRKRERQGGSAASWQPLPAWGLSACELNQKGSQQGDPGDKVTSEPSIRWLRAAPSPG